MANYLERSIQSHSLSFLLSPIFLMWPYVLMCKASRLVIVTVRYSIPMSKNVASDPSILHSKLKCETIRSLAIVVTHLRREFEISMQRDEGSTTFS